MHMLTLEAVKLFLDKLKPDGVVLLHTSNRYLDLNSVLGSTLRVLPEGTAGIVMHDLRSDRMRHPAQSRPRPWWCSPRARRRCSPTVRSTA